MKQEDTVGLLLGTGLEQSLNDLANALDDLGDHLSSLETMLAMVMVPPSTQAVGGEVCRPCVANPSPARGVVDGQTQRVLNFRDKVASIRSNLDL